MPNKYFITLLVLLAVCISQTVYSQSGKENTGLYRGEKLIPQMMVKCALRQFDLNQMEKQKAQKLNAGIALVNGKLVQKYWRSSNKIDVVAYIKNEDGDWDEVLLIHLRWLFVRTEKSTDENMPAVVGVYDR